ncbi:MAG: metallophosphoesterase, partial [Clostridia bacterium]|nr:metallophosphoesterase [Clostridia bacterium]
MKTLQKLAGRDFTVLNVTDLHAYASTFEEGDVTGKVMRYTMDELIRRTSPDLITFGGDIASDYNIEVYRDFCRYMDSFNIPWAPVMGNHDNR